MALLFLVITTAALGIHGAYYGALADACLKIGRELAGVTNESTGFQDAITPPSSTNARLLNWLITIGVIFASFYFLEITYFIAIIVIRLFSTILSGAYFKSEPPKINFVKQIYGSMANREADYAAKGDYIRADAMRELRETFEQKFTSF